VRYSLELVGIVLGALVSITRQNGGRGRAKTARTGPAARPSVGSSGLMPSSPQDFQGGEAVAALFGGEDGAVVGEQGCRDTPGAEGGQDGVDERRALW
jgi:hypothetical protein